MPKPDSNRGPDIGDLVRCLTEARKRKVMVRICLKRDNNVRVDRWTWVIKVKKDRVIVLCLRLWKIGELINASQIRRILQHLMSSYYHRAYGFPLGSAWERREIPFVEIKEAILPTEAFEVGSPTIH